MILITDREYYVFGACSALYGTSDKYWASTVGIFIMSHVCCKPVGDNFFSASCIWLYIIIKVPSDLKLCERYPLYYFAAILTVDYLTSIDICQNPIHYRTTSNVRYHWIKIVLKSLKYPCVRGMFFKYLTCVTVRKIIKTSEWIRLE